MGIIHCRGLPCGCPYRKAISCHLSEYCMSLRSRLVYRQSLAGDGRLRHVGRHPSRREDRPCARTPSRPIQSSRSWTARSASGCRLGEPGSGPLPRDHHLLRLHVPVRLWLQRKSARPAQVMSRRCMRYMPEGLRIQPGMSDLALDVLARQRDSGVTLSPATTTILDRFRPNGPLRARA